MLRNILLFWSWHLQNGHSTARKPSGRCDPDVISYPTWAYMGLPNSPDALFLTKSKQTWVALRAPGQQTRRTPTPRACPKPLPDSYLSLHPVSLLPPSSLNQPGHLATPLSKLNDSISSNASPGLHVASPPSPFHTSPIWLTISILYEVLCG